MSPAALVVEVSGIQDWIVGHTSELRVIRGGSIALDHAFDAAADHLEAMLGAAPNPTPDPDEAGWSLVMRSSGALTALIDDERAAARCAEEVRGLLGRRLPGLSVRVGVGPWQTRPAPPLTPFQATLASARDDAIGRSTPVPSPYLVGTRACDACGVGSAMAEPVGAGRWQLCWPCRQRANLAPEGTLPDGAELALELSEIGAATLGPRWDGYLAVISADGNAVGRRFAGAGEPRELRHRSIEVEEAVDRVFDAAIDEGVEVNRRLREARDASLPLNPVVRAGDDLRLLVPAHVGLDVAAVLAEGRGLPGCAGVFVCPASLPFARAHEVAEDLLAVAKREARAADREGPPPRVAFAVSSGEPGELADGDGPAPTFTPTTIRQLLHAADTLEASTSSIRNVIAALDTGGRVAERCWQEWRLDRHGEELDALDSLVTGLGGDDPSRSPSVGDGHPLPLRAVLTLRALREARR